MTLANKGYFWKKKCEASIEFQFRTLFWPGLSSSTSFVAATSPAGNADAGAEALLSDSFCELLGLGSSESLLLETCTEHSMQLKLKLCALYEVLELIVPFQFLPVLLTQPLQSLCCWHLLLHDCKYQWFTDRNQTNVLSNNDRLNFNKKHSN